MTAAEVLATWAEMPDAGPDYWDQDNHRIYLDVTEYGDRMTALARAVAALQDVLDLLDERDEETAEVYGESEVATSSLVTTHEVRDALNAALGVEP